MATIDLKLQIKSLVKAMSFYLADRLCAFKFFMRAKLIDNSETLREGFKPRSIPIPFRHQHFFDTSDCPLEMYSHTWSQIFSQSRMISDWSLHSDFFSQRLVLVLTFERLEHDRQLSLSTAREIHDQLTSSAFLFAPTTLAALPSSATAPETLSPTTLAPEEPVAATVLPFGLNPIPPTTFRSPITVIPQLIVRSTFNPILRCGLLCSAAVAAAGDESLLQEDEEVALI